MVVVNNNHLLTRYCKTEHLVIFLWKGTIWVFYFLIKICPFPAGIE